MSESENESRFQRIEKNLDDISKANAEVTKNNAVTSALMKDSFKRNDADHERILASIKDVRNKTALNTSWIYKVVGGAAALGFLVTVGLKFI